MLMIISPVVSGGPIVIYQILVFNKYCNFTNLVMLITFLLMNGKF